eukprot:gene15413-6654_t
MVAYWGQNGVYGIHKERERWEKELDYFCKSHSYDVVVLAFNHIFFDRRNKDNMPGLNFAFHCEDPVSPEYPSLLRCPLIEAGISECQRRGKQVLLSMGGASGSYGFASDSKAKEYAHTIWHLFLGGNNKQSLRPFGRAVLDGVDLDIEGGLSTGYTAFVKEIRKLMNTDSSRKYIIGAAPQCPFPDGFLGPRPGKALGDVGYEFDEVYVQFYNNWCHTGNQRVFYENVAKWLKFSMDSKPSGPMIFVGMPAKVGGSGNAANYRPLKEVSDIFNRLKDEPRFGGFMLWDAGFDQNNIINGKPYSQNIVEIMNSGVVPPNPTGSPQTLPPDTPGPGPVTTDSVPVTQPPPVPPTKPFHLIRLILASVSCTNLQDGHYAHPTDCSKFFICHGGIAHLRSCPGGLKWNDVRKYCDWPANVNCS